MSVVLRDINQIVKEGKSVNGANFPFYNKEENYLGMCFLNIKRFKRSGVLIEIYPPFNIKEEKIRKIFSYLQYILNDIKTQGFREKLEISSSAVKCAVYQGDEEDIIKAIYDILIA
jgi:hypothetical protein